MILGLLLNFGVIAALITSLLISQKRLDKLGDIMDAMADQSITTNIQVSDTILLDWMVSEIRSGNCTLHAEQVNRPGVPWSPPVSLPIGASPHRWPTNGFDPGAYEFVLNHARAEPVRLLVNLSTPATTNVLLKFLRNGNFYLAIETILIDAPYAT